MKIVAIAGSLRAESYNRALLHAAGELAPAGMVIHIEREIGEIPLYNADFEELESGVPVAVRRLRAAVGAADGLLIATPEYNQSLPGVLKNVIDWLSRPAPDEVLAGKPVAIIGASSGPWGTRLAQAALRQVLAATESRVLPAPMLFVRDCTHVFDFQRRLTDETTRRRLQALLQAFANWTGAWSQ